MGFLGTRLGISRKENEREEQEDDTPTEALIKYDVRRETAIVVERIGFVGGAEKEYAYCRRRSHTNILRDFDGNLIVDMKPRNITYRERVEETKAAFWYEKKEWVRLGGVMDRMDELKESDHVQNVRFVESR